MPNDSDLPIFDSPFIGRKRELEETGRLLSEARFLRETVIKIVGPAGSGKTHFAHEVARRQRRLSPIWLNLGEQTDWPAEIRRRWIDRALSEIHPDGNRDWRHEEVLAILDGVERASNSTLLECRSAIFNHKRVVALILTSRTPVHVKGHDIFLGAMTSDDARDFLRTQIKSALDTRDLDALVRKSGGNVLALTLLTALLKERAVDQILSALDGHIYNLEQPQGSKIIQAVRPQIVTFSNELALQLKRTPEKMHDVTSRQFEQLIAEIFDDMGWEVELTKATRDGGRDILAHLNTGAMKMLCLIEAKKYRKDRPVGVQLVRNLYGTFCDEQANSAMLVTTSYFTGDAKTFRDKHKYQLTLKDYADIVGWLARYKGNE